MSELGDAIANLEVALAELRDGLERTKASLREWQASMVELREAFRVATTYREVNSFHGN